MKLLYSQYSTQCKKIYYPQIAGESKSNVVSEQFQFWYTRFSPSTLQWRHYERIGVSNQRRLDCLLSHSFRQIKENIKAPRHWPLWGAFISQRCFPLTKGQYRGKCFHLMTSSYSFVWNIVWHRRNFLICGYLGKWLSTHICLFHLNTFRGI